MAKLSYSETRGPATVAEPQQDRPIPKEERPMIAATAAGPETLRDQINRVEEMATDRYAELVRMAASGGKVNIADDLPTITAAGRNLDQFEADIETRKRRLQAAKDIAQADAMATEVTKAQDQAGKAAEAVMKLEQEYARKLDAARRAANEARDDANSVADRRTRLRVDGRNVLYSTAATSIDDEIHDAQAGIDRDQESLRHLYESIQRQSVYADNPHVHLDGRQSPAERLAMLYRQRDKLHEDVARGRQRIEELNASKLDVDRQRWA